MRAEDVHRFAGWVMDRTDEEHIPDRRVVLAVVQDFDRDLLATLDSAPKSADRVQPVLGTGGGLHWTPPRIEATMALLGQRSPTSSSRMDDQRGPGLMGC